MPERKQPLNRRVYGSATYQLTVTTLRSGESRAA